MEQAEELTGKSDVDNKEPITRQCVILPKAIRQKSKDFEFLSVDGKQKTMPEIVSFGGSYFCHMPYEGADDGYKNRAKPSPMNTMPSFDSMPPGFRQAFQSFW